MLKARMATIAFVLKRSKPNALRLARDLFPWLKRQGVRIIVPEGASPVPQGATVVPLKELRHEADFVVVLGGDGTFLSAAHLVGDSGLPLLGINLGSLGFLTVFTVREAREALEAALRGRLPVEERMRLRVKILSDGKVRAERCAVNDAVLSQGALARLIELEAFTGETRITTYRADGLIVSTPTGSTAYTLAAGGPILRPDLEAMVVTPICPFTLADRPLVVPGNTKLRITPGKRARNVVLTVDGQWGEHVEPGDSVLMERARKPLRLYLSEKTNFYEILRTKLHWSREPRGNGGA